MTDPVHIAITALEHLQADNRDEARKLLDMYAGRHELTEEQRRQIIEHFPDRRA